MPIAMRRSRRDTDQGATCSSFVHRAGLSDLERAARAGQYDDYESESPTPIHDLVADLLRARRKDLAQRAASGEWDGTEAEARRWMTENGRRILGEEQT